jgi:uncharacterized protein
MTIAPCGYARDIATGRTFIICRIGTSVTTRTKRAPYSEKNSLVFEYAFDPSQDTKFDVDKGCIWYDRNERKVGTIFSLDEDNGLVEIKVGSKQGVPPDKLNRLPNEFVSAQKIADSIFCTISQWCDTGKLPPAIDDFLRRRRPRLKGNKAGPVVKPGSDALPGIVDAATSLQNSTLCIQGPPGSGKTYCGIDLLRQGKKIGVTSNSHKAIAKLLSEVDHDAKIAKVSFAGVKIQSEDVGAGVNAKFRQYFSLRQYDHEFVSATYK